MFFDNAVYGQDPPLASKLLPLERCIPKGRARFLRAAYGSAIFRVSFEALLVVVQRSFFLVSHIGVIFRIIQKRIE